MKIHKEKPGDSRGKLYDDRRSVEKEKMYLPTDSISPFFFFNRNYGDLDKKMGDS